MAPHRLSEDGFPGERLVSSLVAFALCISSIIISRLSHRVWPRLASENYRGVVVKAQAFYTS